MPVRTFTAALALVVPMVATTAREASPQARLETGWISREPRIPPPNRPDAPPEEGWPEVGSRVRWVAHVLNRGSEVAPAVLFSWRVDGAATGEGVIDLPPGETAVELPWTWSFERHEISFAIAPPPALGDATAEDDAVSVASDALSVGFWVEQGAYDWLAGGGRPGFERVAQREIGRWNTILARAVYPSTPDGCLDRLRLDRILVDPDGSDSRVDDLDTDVRWWVPNHSDDQRFLHRGVADRYLADQTIILHEMLHGRGLTDVYAYEVFHDFPNGSHIGIEENGRLVAGTFLMPFLPGWSTIVYRLPEDGLMGRRIRASADLTEHSANGLNRRAGRRTPLWIDEWGNVVNGFSSQYQVDSYLEVRPEVTDVRIRDQEERPVPNAEVGVFLDHGFFAYSDRYEAEPDAVLSTDSSGVVPLPGALLIPPRVAQQAPSSKVVILRVRTSAARGYAFLPVFDLNVLYFRGHTGRADLEVDVDLHPWSHAIQ